MIAHNVFEQGRTFGIGVIWLFVPDYSEYRLIFLFYYITEKEHSYCKGSLYTSHSHEHQCQFLQSDECNDYYSIRLLIFRSRGVTTMQKVLLVCNVLTCE